MVKHTVFGVERNIDIYDNVFPTAEELEEMEGRLPGCEHGWFDSVDQPPLKLHYRKFLPKESPKAIVIWMHGIQTHCGRAHILKNGRKINMALLSDRVVGKEGYALYAFDMTGHGYSEGKRFLVTNTVLDDYLNFIKLVVNLHDEGTPLFLMAESFGGNLSVQVAKHFQVHPEQCPKGFLGIILLAAAIYGYQLFFPVDLALKYFLAPIIPRFRPPTILPNPVSPTMLWRDPEVLYVNAQEERVTEMWLEPAERHSNLRTSSTLIEAMKRVRDHCIPGLQVPFCALHGTSDRAVPIAGALEYMLEHIDTPEEDRAVKRVGGAYHDLLGDPTAEQNLDFVVAWITKRLGATKPH